MRILVLFFFISSTCFGQQGIFKTDVVVDGDLSEWGEKLDHYDKENMLWYSVANDDDFLYLAIHKDKHALKIYSEVHVYVSGKEISKDSPSVIYSVSKNNLGRYIGGVPDWDFVVIRNMGDRNRDTLSVFNGLGIGAIGRMEETEEAKEEKKQIDALSIGGQRIVTNAESEPAPSKGMAAYLEFAIPLKLIKSISENINIKIRLKGGSGITDPSSLSAFRRNAPDGPGKEEALDTMIETENTFTYKLAKKEK